MRLLLITLTALLSTSAYAQTEFDELRALIEVACESDTTEEYRGEYNGKTGKLDIKTLILAKLNGIEAKVDANTRAITRLSANASTTSTATPTVTPRRRTRTVNRDYNYVYPSDIRSTPKREPRKYPPVPSGTERHD